MGGNCGVCDSMGEMREGREGREGGLGETWFGWVGLGLIRWVDGLVWYSAYGMVWWVEVMHEISQF